jgi:hypothetical protein
MEANKEEEFDNIFGGDEFVFTTKGGEVVGGGYKIKSFFLQGGESPMVTMNTSDQNGGKVSSPFENLAVPAGLFYVNMRVPKKYVDRDSEEHYKPHETISDDMIDKLYSLVEVDKKRKRKTRKHHIKQDKTKTRRVK